MSYTFQFTNAELGDIADTFEVYQEVVGSSHYATYTDKSKRAKNAVEREQKKALVHEIQSICATIGVTPKNYLEEETMASLRAIKSHLIQLKKNLF